jgi:sigma-B regulation protein RsbU (phosphoserine phosphatase)
MPQEIANLKLRRRELERNALIETIRSINNNAPEDALFRLYHLTLRSNMSISKFVLFVKDQTWKVRAWHQSGEPQTDYTKMTLPDKVLSVREPTPCAELDLDAPFDDFSYLLPIRHKAEVLAYLFIGRILTEYLDQEELNVSLDYIEALTNIIVVAVENKKLARKQKEQDAINQQLKIAKEVQTLLLPKTLPHTDQISIQASYQPHHNLGGDYYDYIRIDEDRFLVCVADVSGKGVPAAILMSNFQAGLRTLARQTDNLKKIVVELNNLIIENSGGENFITAFFFIYDKKNHSATYINAGHNAPLLFRSQTEVHSLQEGTTILGIFKELPFLNLATLEEMDEFLLFCFTDGFTETSNEDGQEFGEESLITYITRYYQLSQEKLHEKLFSYLNSFRGNNGFADDITLLSCRVSLKENRAKSQTP